MATGQWAAADYLSRFAHGVCIDMERGDLSGFRRLGSRGRVPARDLTDLARAYGAVTRNRSNCTVASSVYRPIVPAP